MSGDPNGKIDEVGLEQATEDPKVQAAAEPATEEPAAPSWSEEDEALARQFGWVDQDKFKGTGWRDAGEFAKLIRDRFHKAGRLEKEVENLKASVSQRVEAAVTAAEHVFARDKARLEAQRAEAVDQGDRQSFDRYDKELRELEQARPQAVPQRPQEPDEVVAFKQRNPWYGAQNGLGRAASVWASERSNELAQQGYGVEDQLQIVEQELSDNFPKLAPKPAVRPVPQPSHAAVDGGSTSHAARMLGGKSKTGFEGLPADAKEAFQMLVKKGYLKDEDGDKKYYAESYRNSK